MNLSNQYSIQALIFGLTKGILLDIVKSNTTFRKGGLINDKGRAYR